MSFTTVYQLNFGISLTYVNSYPSIRDQSILFINYNPLRQTTSGRMSPQTQSTRRRWTIWVTRSQESLTSTSFRSLFSTGTSLFPLRDQCAWPLGILASTPCVTTRAHQKQLSHGLPICKKKRCSVKWNWQVFNPTAMSNAFLLDRSPSE